MKKYLIILCIFLLIFSLSSCENGEQNFVIDYNGEQYTRCENWSFINHENEFEDIVITFGTEDNYSAQRLKDDMQANFIWVHDILCVKNNIELPSIKEKNKITAIRLELLEDTKIFSSAEDINYFVDIFTAADNNENETNDAASEIEGFVYVQFENLPIEFFAGRILKNKNNMFFSSSVNANVKHNKLLKSYYSVPIKID